MRTFIAALLLLLTPALCNAGSFFRYGVGIVDESQFGASKSFSLGYEEDWFGPLIHQYEAGLYVDQNPGRSNSAYGSYSIGVEVFPEPLVLRSLWGVGAITNPDSRLGGWFQFNQDLILGVKDRKGNMIGVDLKHISSGGIEMPNYGRNFLMVHVEIPW